MTDNNLPINEFEKAQINDLADGFLRGAAFADAMALLDTSTQARAYWYGLHVAGDVVRGETSSNLPNVAKDMAFLNTFKANLVKELPLKTIAQVNHALAVDVPAREPEANANKVANDAVFNWKWLGGFSAAAAVVAFSWNLVSNTATSPNGSGSQLAQSALQATTVAATVTTPSAAGVMLRNPQLDALIAAHNQAGGNSALQMPSGFLRSATFNTSVPATMVSDK